MPKLFLLVLLISISAASYAQSRSEKVAWLRAHTYRLSDEPTGPINPGTLTSLDSIFAQKRIIVLSEQNHLDGGTQRAQATILKYLYEEHGFDGILLERGINATHQAYQDMLARRDSVAGVFMWLLHLNGRYIHLCERQIANVITASLQKEDPILLGGINISERTVYRNALDSVVLSYLTLKSSGETSAIVQLTKKYLSKVRSINGNAFYGNDRVVVKTNKERLRNQMEEIVAFIACSTDSTATAEEILYRKHLEQGVKATYYTSLYYIGGCERELLKSEFNPYNRMRDSIMADNMRFYLENYPDRKFVVIVSSYHAAKALPVVTKPYREEKLKPLMSYLAEEYGDDLYSIGAIYYQGARGDNGLDWRTYRKIKPAKKESIEELLHAAGIQVGLVDFSSPAARESWLNSDQIMMQHRRMKAPRNWLDMYDAVLYIDEMTPAELRTDIRRIGMKQPY